MKEIENENKEKPFYTLILDVGASTQVLQNQDNTYSWFPKKRSLS